MSKVNKIKASIDDAMYNNELSNDDIVELIKHVGAYGNIMSVKDYSDRNGITVQGVYNHRNVVNIWGFKFVVQND
jgi:hypothetical protein